MGKIHGSERTIELLVNCKTYPAVSRKYMETVCTGGVQADGQFVRLYPVPFRFLDEDEQYARWDVIKVQAYKDTKDTRPESWHLKAGTKIEKVKSITTEKRRWEWMKHTIHESTDVMETNGITNGCVEIVPSELYWKPDRRQWSDSQLNVFKQQNLFVSEEDLRSLADRVPWQFRLKFTEKNSGKSFDAKILAWSLYQGLRRRLRTMDDKSALAETADVVSKSIFNPEKTVFAIVGTHSRFGHWMISALYHVPTKIINSDIVQGATLF